MSALLSSNQIENQALTADLTLDDAEIFQVINKHIPTIITAFINASYMPSILLSSPNIFVHLNSDGNTVRKAWPPPYIDKGPEEHSS